MCLEVRSVPPWVLPPWPCAPVAMCRDPEPAGLLFSLLHPPAADGWSPHDFSLIPLRATTILRVTLLIEGRLHSRFTLLKKGEPYNDIGPSVFTGDPERGLPILGSNFESRAGIKE